MKLYLIEDQIQSRQRSLGKTQMSSYNCLHLYWCGCYSGTATAATVQCAKSYNASLHLSHKTHSTQSSDLILHCDLCYEFFLCSHLLVLLVSQCLAASGITKQRVTSSLSVSLFLILSSLLVTRSRGWRCSQTCVMSFSLFLFPVWLFVRPDRCKCKFLRDGLPFDVCISCSLGCSWVKWQANVFTSEWCGDTGPSSVASRLLPVSVPAHFASFLLLLITLAAGKQSERMIISIA